MVVNVFYLLFHLQKTFKSLMNVNFFIGKRKDE